MWVANAATVSPSADTADGRVHFTPANLLAHFHRSLEAPTTARVLRAIFADTTRFVVHDALPAAPQFGDEGAANHTRFAGADAAAGGVEFFVFGRHGAGGGPAPARYVARQTFEASAAVARRHGLDSARVVFAQQNPAAIDAGVFHNDVIAVGHRHLLLCHEQAFVDQHAVLADLARCVGPAFHCRRRARGRRVARRCRVDVPLQQPARVAPGWRDGARGARRGTRESARGRAARPPRRARGSARRGAHVRPAREHAQRRRPGVPAAARGARGRRARRDRRQRVPRRRARATRSKRGSPATTATASRPPISPIRRCSTNRGARWTS